MDVGGYANSWKQGNIMTTIDTITSTFVSKFDLPIHYNSTEDFHGFLFDKLDEFNNFIVDSVNDVPSECADLQKVTKCQDAIQLIIENIKKAFDEYYNGRPDLAYSIFEKVLVELSSLETLPERSFHREGFYRIRIGEDITTRKDIFHIPFSRRTLVAPQRYSIAGFPCLYLANSIYVAWEEFHRPSLDTLNFTKLQFSNPVNFINFSPLDFRDSLYSSSDLLAFFQKMLLYPVLLICSVKVAKPDNPFKPEYIFSQFTLRWCKEKDNYNGVMYGSTRVNPNSKGRFYNFAIPVSDYQINTDFCPELTQKIKLTNPFSLKGVDNETVMNNINEDIIDIFSKELHKIIPFNQSIFALIESFLQNQELRRLS